VKFTIWTAIRIKIFHFIALQNITMVKIILFAAITLVALFIQADAGAILKEVEEKAAIGGK